MIIDKESIPEHHYNTWKGDHRKHIRINTNIDLNNEGRVYTDLYKISNTIKNNKRYIDAINYLSNIYK